MFRYWSFYCNFSVFFFIFYSKITNFRLFLWPPVYWPSLRKVKTRFRNSKNIGWLWIRDCRTPQIGTENYSKGNTNADCKRIQVRNFFDFRFALRKIWPKVPRCSATIRNWFRRSTECLPTFWRCATLGKKNAKVDPDFVRNWFKCPIKNFWTFCTRWNSRTIIRSERRRVCTDGMWILICRSPKSEFINYNGSMKIWCDSSRYLFIHSIVSNWDAIQADIWDDFDSIDF